MANSDTPKGPEVTDVASAASAIEAMLTREDGDGEPSEQGDEPKEAEAEVEAKIEAPEEAEPDEAEETDQSEDEEGDEEEATSEDDEEAEEEPVDEPQKLTVKVDGEEVEVSVDELKAGYSRQADYTRKTMALANERKQLEQVQQELDGMRGQYSAVLEVWKQQLDTAIGDDNSPEVQALRQSNPAEYAARVAESHQRRDRLAAIVQEQQRLAQEDAMRDQEGLKAIFKEEGHLLMRALPEWQKPEAAKADREQMYSYAADLYTLPDGQKVGFSPEELASVTDHRVLYALRDAARYRALQSRSKNVQQQPKRAAVKTATPGAAKSKVSSKSRNMDRDMKRFRQTHHVDDAARLIERMLPD
jgi:hypothetical protein